MPKNTNIIKDDFLDYPRITLTNLQLCDPEKSFMKTMGELENRIKSESQS